MMVGWTRVVIVDMKRSKWVWEVFGIRIERRCSLVGLRE